MLKIEFLFTKVGPMKIELLGILPPTRKICIYTGAYRSQCDNYTCKSKLNWKREKIAKKVKFFAARVNNVAKQFRSHRPYSY